MPDRRRCRCPPEADADARPTRSTPRKAAILEAVVTEYIGTAQPVGSQHVADAAGVKVSSATVRSEMAALEHEGYLVQPHTSAGRIPTDKGYRFFVDHLAEPGVLGPAQRQKVRRFFDQVHGEMEEHARADLGPAVRPDLATPRWSSARRHEAAPIRSVQLVGPGPAPGPARRRCWPTGRSRSAPSSCDDERRRRGAGRGRRPPAPTAWRATACRPGAAVPPGSATPGSTGWSTRATRRWPT